MNNLILQFAIILNTFKNNSAFTFGILAILFAVQIANWTLHYKLNYFGIYPRSFHGLIGIICAPFLHGDFNHLFFNAIPLFLLINLALLQGTSTFFCVTFSIIIISGLLLWLIGRKAMHIGASMLTMGYWSYLLMNIFYQGLAFAVILGVICVYYLGGLFFELFPGEKGKSWEGHLCGFVAGILTTYFCLPELFAQLVKLINV